MHKGIIKFLVFAVIISMMLAGCGTKELNIVNDQQLANTVYQNPLSVSGIGDPFVLKTESGDYYMYATSLAEGYLCWKSTDLVNWDEVGVCFTYNDNPNSWGFKNFWAPEVVEYEGKYYMYYTAESVDSIGLRIGVAVSDKPDGPFKEALGKPLFDFGHAVIDANVLIDDDGQKYLYYSKDCSQNIVNGQNTSQICVVKLSDDMLSVEGEEKVLITPEQKWEKISGNTLWNEAPEVIKNNGKYYLMYSANFYGSRNYSVGYAVSDKPDSGFVKPENNPILSAGDNPYISGSGHHGITVSPDGKEMVAVYHTHVDPLEGGGNRQLNLCTIGFDEKGQLYMNGPTIGKQPYPSNKDSYNIIKGLTPEISAKDSKGAKKLTDGQFAIHANQTGLSWTANAAGTNLITLTLNLAEKKEIQSILLYKPADDKWGFTSAKVKIDGKYEGQLKQFTDDINERMTILSFDAVEGKKVEIEFIGSSASLSEIIVLGK